MTTISRRTAIAAPVVVIAANAIGSKAHSNAVGDTGGDLQARKSAAIELRAATTARAMARELPHHPTNGDEENLRLNGEQSYIANYTKGLPHNNFGEVDFGSIPDSPTGSRKRRSAIVRTHPARRRRPGGTRRRPSPVCCGVSSWREEIYRAHAERALLSADSTQMRFIDPQAAFAFDLESADSHTSVMPPPPCFGSKEIIAEIAENYWMALCRDVPFAHYSDATGPAADAVKNLNLFAEFKGPMAGGKVTADTVFRGSTPGDLGGPYVSQFLMNDIPFGAYQLPQKLVFNFAGDPVFMNNETDWLARQRGIDPNQNPIVNPDPKYIYRGRDLANFVHIDELFQAYLNAALLMGAPPARGGLAVPHNRGNPYDGFVPGSNPPDVRISTQLGFGTLGEPNIKSMVAEVASRALKAVWYQKWNVHRRLRPEVFAGRLHYHVTGQRIYPFDASELAKLDTTLQAVQTFNAANGGSGSFLPMAFPEGSPLHPSYGAGHATVAGACVTILKALYEGSLSFAELNAPVFLPSDDGSAPHNLQAADFKGIKYSDLAPQLTIAGELNKLASNVSLGRNFAGVHWRSDHIESQARRGRGAGVPA